MIIIIEGTVAIDIELGAFVDDVIDTMNIESLDELCTRSVLDAVVWSEDLRLIMEHNRLTWLELRM
jgi:propanediol dehydratase small subunit